ncbi:hypothetical protein DVH05_008309 [Phytophthora capsici]|nr:hypothetical protein DVH05_008309 [Phytophthora capsici]
MPGRISVKGKSRKPPKYKNTSETFEFKAAVLSLYDSTTMTKAVAAFWPAIPQRSKTYATKKGVILRWNEPRARVESLAASVGGLLTGRMLLDGCAARGKDWANTPLKVVLGK